MWRKLFELKFHQFSRDLSAAWIWSRIRRIGRSRYSLFREKLGYLEGGSGTLLNALERNIKAGGGEFKMATPVERVVIEDGKVLGLKTPAGTESFSKVISTIPLPYVPRLMPDLPEEILAKFRNKRNIAVVCVIAKLRKPISKYFWVNTNDPSMDIPGIVEYTNLRPLDHHIAYVPFYMPGENAQFADPDEIFIGKVQKYLKRINPQLTDEDFIEIRANRYRHAQPICEPKFLETLPNAKLPIVGLWAADTSYYYPEDRGISESIEFGRKLAKAAILD